MALRQAQGQERQQKVDNNNPNPTAASPAGINPQGAVAPQPPPASVIQETPPPSGNNKMLLLIAGIVVLLLIIGGIYWFMGRKNVTQPKATPKPTAQTQSVDSLEKDLNSTSLDDLDKEFSSVDTDLQGL